VATVSRPAQTPVPQLPREHPLHDGPPLPGTLDMFTLRFRPGR
jgi:hypothetical protein